MKCVGTSTACVCYRVSPTSSSDYCTFQLRLKNGLVDRLSLELRSLVIQLSQEFLVPTRPLGYLRLFPISHTTVISCTSHRIAYAFRLPYSYDLNYPAY